MTRIFRVKLAVGLAVMAMVSLAPASVEQPSESPIDLVRQTVQRELAPGNGGAKLIFEDRKETPHGSQTKLVVETRDGTVGMTIAMNGKPLTPEQRQTEEERLAGLVNNPEQLRKKQRSEKKKGENWTGSMRPFPTLSSMNLMVPRLELRNSASPATRWYASSFAPI